MQMQWRPNNWEYGAWQKAESRLRNPPIIVGERLYNAFESGADAMLEAQKSMGVHGTWIKEGNVYYLDHLRDPLMQQGWLIIIPDK